MATAHADTDILNSLLRGEISATETYVQALEKFAGEPEESLLQQLRNEHREAANSLRQHVHTHGGEPVQGSGLWGVWAKFVEGTAKAFGKSAALKALKEGEEHGVKEYESAIAGTDLAVDCRSLISQLLPQCKAHIVTLDGLIAGQK